MRRRLPLLLKTIYEDLSQKLKWMEIQMAVGAFQNLPSSMSLKVGSGRASYYLLQTLGYATT